MTLFLDTLIVLGAALMYGWCCVYIGWSLREELKPDGDFIQVREGQQYEAPKSP